MRNKGMRDAAAKFRRDMEKLGLGVSIRIGDGPDVEVVPTPHEPDRPDCECKSCRAASRDVTEEPRP